MFQACRKDVLFLSLKALKFQIGRLKGVSRLGIILLLFYQFLDFDARYKVNEATVDADLASNVVGRGCGDSGHVSVPPVASLDCDITSVGYPTPTRKLFIAFF